MVGFWSESSCFRNVVCTLCEGRSPFACVRFTKSVPTHFRLHDAWRLRFVRATLNRTVPWCQFQHHFCCKRIRVPPISARWSLGPLAACDTPPKELPKKMMSYGMSYSRKMAYSFANSARRHGMVLAMRRSTDKKS